MTEPILEIKKLNKSFGPVHVLHDVSLSCLAGATRQGSCRVSPGTATVTSPS